MVNIVYGPKGSGKTKRLLDLVNKEAMESGGNVVFVDDDKRYMYDVKHQIRFVDVREYHIDNADKLFGFVSGMLSQNFDIAAVYIDCFLKIIAKKADEVEELLGELCKISDAHNCKLVINITGPADNVPAFLDKYII